MLWKESPGRNGIYDLIINEWKWLIRWDEYQVRFLFCGLGEKSVDGAQKQQSQLYESFKTKNICIILGVRIQIQSGCRLSTEEGGGNRCQEDAAALS